MKALMRAWLKHTKDLPCMPLAKSRRQKNEGRPKGVLDFIDGGGTDLTLTDLRITNPSMDP